MVSFQVFGEGGGQHMRILPERVMNENWNWDADLKP